MAATVRTVLSGVLSRRVSISANSRCRLPVASSTQLHRCRSTGAPEQVVAMEMFRPETTSAPTLMDIGTRRIFQEEHDIYRASARRFWAEEVLPNHPQYEKDGQVSREVWLKAGEQGLLGVNTPEELGGIGADVLYSAVMWEEQSYSNCSGPGFALHTDIVMPYIAKYGSREQQEKF